MKRRGFSSKSSLSPLQLTEIFFLNPKTIIRSYDFIWYIDIFDIFIWYINKSSIFKEEKRENIRTGWYWVFLSSGSFVFLFNGWNFIVICKIALACFILYRKTLSTFGITFFVDTRSTTRQIAIRSIISLSTCYQKK